MLKWTNAANQATALITTNRLQNVIAAGTPSPSSRLNAKYNRRTCSLSYKENAVAASPLDLKRPWHVSANLINSNDTSNCHREDIKSPKSVCKRYKRRRTGIGVEIENEIGSVNRRIQNENHNFSLIKRRHSIDFSTTTIDSGKYAQTLPLCSPLVNTSTTLLPRGQELALRGLWLDPILSKQRYFNSNDNLLQIEMEVKSLITLPKEIENESLRNLEDEFPEIAQADINEENSSTLDDEALDKLIDAILESARKAETKKKKLSRKSFNLRRRSLLKNTTVESERIENLSSTYTAGLDPANDLNLNFLKKNFNGIVTETINTPTAQKATKHLWKTSNQSIRKRHSSLIALTPQMESNIPEAKRKKLYLELNDCTDLGIALPSLYV